MQTRSRWGEGGGSAHATAAAIETLVDTVTQDPLGGRGTVVGFVDPDNAAATDAGGRCCRGHLTARGRRRETSPSTRPADEWLLAVPWSAAHGGDLVRRWPWALTVNASPVVDVASAWPSVLLWRPLRRQDLALASGLACQRGLGCDLVCCGRGLSPGLALGFASAGRDLVRRQCGLVLALGPTSAWPLASGLARRLVVRCGHGFGLGLALGFALASVAEMAPGLALVRRPRPRP